MNRNIPKIKMGKKSVIITIMVLLLILIAANYIILFPLNIQNPSLWIYVIIGLAFINVILRLSKNKKIQSLASKLLMLVITIFIITIISSLPVFRSKAYRNLMNNVEYKEFNSSVSPIDLKKVPIIDDELAKLLADKKLGEIPALGSEVVIGNMTIQSVKGELYYVAPLEHSGFFQWSRNKQGTQGYIMVNATKTNDVQLVTKVNGNDLNLKYLNSSYLNDNLKRHLYFKNPTGLYTDYSFELDDEGNPYWVVTEYSRAIGFSGEKAKGVYIVDAQTGGTTRYSIEDTPKWVDRIQPIDISVNNFNYWGKYVHGFFNFSNRDKLKTTDGVKTVYYGDECYYYTGITSVGKDESLVGFALMNSKTNEATIYNVAGSTEKAAMSSAEGKVQNLGYTATFPVLVNIQGQPSYFMTLKDKGGLAKMYAIVNVEHYNIVSTGETPEEAVAGYIKSLQNSSVSGDVDNTGISKTIEGTVQRIGMSINNDESTCYITLSENPKELILVPTSVSKKVPLTKEGDKVRINYIERPNSDIIANEFDNMSFELK